MLLALGTAPGRVLVPEWPCALRLVDYASPKSFGADGDDLPEMISSLLAGAGSVNVERGVAAASCTLPALVLRFQAVAMVRCFRLEAHASGIASRKVKRCS